MTADLSDPPNGTTVKTIVQLVWATLERALPRVASAIILIAFAAFTSPEAVGIYSWVVLTYTLYQALAENALRNQAVLGIENPASVAWVQRAARAGGTFGVVAIAVTLGLLFANRGSHGSGEVLGLVPFALAPLITTAGVVPTARLQFRQEWRHLARYQLVAAAAGLSLALTTVWLTHASLAMSVHVITTEMVFLLLLRRRSGRIDIPVGPGTRHPREGFWSLTLLSALGWSQGQVERVFIGGLAGTGRLGLYSASVTMGRSPGEALSVATANYLRASISGEPDEVRHSLTVRRIATVSVLAATAAVFVVMGLVERVLTPILGDRWQSALAVVPVLAVATIPYALSLTLQVMAVFAGRPKASIVPAVLAICCAPVIGVVAVESIHAAALVVVAKELMVLIVCQVLAKVSGATRPVLLATSLTLIMLGLVELLP